MSQITESFALTMLKHCDQGQHPPLTVWEARQFIWAWLELHKAQGDPVGMVVDTFDGYTKVRMLVPQPSGTKLYTSVPPTSEEIVQLQEHNETLHKLKERLQRLTEIMPWHRGDEGSPDVPVLQKRYDALRAEAKRWEDASVEHEQLWHCAAREVARLEAELDTIRKAQSEPVAWYDPEQGLPYGWTEQAPTKDAINLYTAAPTATDDWKVVLEHVIADSYDYDRSGSRTRDGLTYCTGCDAYDYEDGKGIQHNPGCVTLLAQRLLDTLNTVSAPSKEQN